ncbi:unnamed protein product [Adineta steineri]|uniref:Uncharacterized protein n=1 Tax=Adineta steineri TaxID=433720 RepID=A0A813VAE1_9BILA|nr:unnamed protein product [Adineta steineri]CAF0943451.1 unnamed protein product [Adineta steineri]CAF0977202.1 unnamed protein product [Adineta steineri]
MTRVIALHGSTGAGKSTLTRLMGEHWGTNCHVMEEVLEGIMAVPSSDDKHMSWYRQKPAFAARDNVTSFFMAYISPISVLIFTLINHYLTGTVWPVIILFLIFLAIGRFFLWFNSTMLSKMWFYNVSYFNDQQNRSNRTWIWRDRTCLDVYTYALMDNYTSVPLNMRQILLEETHTTSVAIILDVPEHIIKTHLRRRMNAPTTTFWMAFATRLILLFKIPIRSSINALKLVERWYQKMNVPVIKISQLRDKLDYDLKTGDIQWNKHSINVLQKAIDEAIEKRGLPSATVDESLIPWQTVQNSRLVHYY